MVLVILGMVCNAMSKKKACLRCPQFRARDNNCTVENLIIVVIVGHENGINFTFGIILL